LIKYLHPIRPDSAKGLVAGVYDQIRLDFGRVVEPFLLHSPLPELLAGVWMACRETELVGSVPRVVKETVATAVSQLNNCQYCIDAHTIILSAMGEGNVAKAIDKASPGEIQDPNLRLIVDWAHATTSPESDQLRFPPFSKEEVPEIVGTTVFYHYINRIATVFLGETPLASNQRWIKDPMKRIAGLMFSSAVQRSKNVGDSLQFLPKADLPASYYWAKASPNVAWAYASFVSAVEKAGAASLPVEARRYVREEIGEWNGKASELNLAWSEETICKFDEATEASARLALLTALAPREVDEGVVSAFVKQFPGDEKLLGAVSWASLEAAKKIGSWLLTPKTEMLTRQKTDLI
jgi:AhpD family alkylhydroperoxidase